MKRLIALALGLLFIGSLAYAAPLSVKQTNGYCVNQKINGSWDTGVIDTTRGSFLIVQPDYDNSEFFTCEAIWRYKNGITFAVEPLAWYETDVKTESVVIRFFPAASTEAVRAVVICGSGNDWFWGP